jgi:hypothetical protein
MRKAISLHLLADVSICFAGTRPQSSPQLRMSNRPRKQEAPLGNAKFLEMDTSEEGSGGRKQKQAIVIRTSPGGNHLMIGKSANTKTKDKPPIKQFSQR